MNTSYIGLFIGHIYLYHLLSLTRPPIENWPLLFCCIFVLWYICCASIYLVSVLFTCSWREGVVTEMNKKDDTVLTVHFPGTHI